MKKSVMIFIVFLLLINSVVALRITGKGCETNGKFNLILEAIDKNQTYTNEIKIEVDNKEIIGKWDIDYMRKNPPDRRRQYGSFTSDEAQVLGGGNKLIKITYPLEYEGVKSFEAIQATLECPPFLFSCALLNVEINECYTEDNVFYAYFTLNGFEQTVNSKLSLENNLGFNLVTTAVYEDIDDKIITKGAKPKKAEVKKYEGNKYIMIFEFPTKNFVESFRVGLTNIDMCLNSKYETYHLKLSDFKKCGEKIEEIIEENKKVVEEVVNEKPEERIIEDAVFEPVEEDKNEVILAIALVLIVVIGFAILYKIRKI
ncbi:MAG: hypothetical protein KKG75_03530 [Nanoarchaeota archaeon]|nr:hypothetical protein [Nanoarchaeota archaeon]